MIGKENISLFHINDSKEDLNSRLDRVKTFNLNLELEIFQFLNKFH